MRIGVDDGLQLSFLPAVPLIAVRVVAADEAFVGAAHIRRRCGIGETQRRQRLGIAESGPAARARGRAIAAEQIMRIAEMEGFAAALARRGALPAGERRLRRLDFIGAEAIEEVIGRIEGADMFEAQELPAAIAAGQAVRQRRAEFTGQRATGVVAAGGFGAFDAAMQAAGALGRFRLFSGNVAMSLGVAGIG